MATEEKEKLIKENKTEKTTKKKKSLVVVADEEMQVKEGNGGAGIRADFIVMAAAEAKAQREGSEVTTCDRKGRGEKAVATKERRRNQNNKNRREKKKAAAEAEASAVGMERIFSEIQVDAAVIPSTMAAVIPSTMEMKVEEIMMVKEAVVSPALIGEKEEIDKEDIVVSVSVKPAAVAPEERGEEDEEVVTAEGGDKDGAERALNSVPNESISTPLKKQRKRKKNKNGGAAAATKTTNGTC
ncbi:hypothetical protein VYU27_002344 [Nannochloropsis oceanica]